MTRLPALALLIAVVVAGSAHPARAARFEKISADVDKVVPAAQQGGGGTPAITANAEPHAEVATFVASIFESIDCSASCDTPECMGNTLCSNLADIEFQILPDPGESIGDPVRVCVEHGYDMTATSTAGYTTTVITGGVPITTATSVIRTPGGTEFSNGPVIITSGHASDQIESVFSANVGDVIDMRLGTQVTVVGMGIGSGRGVQSARLDVFSCGPIAPAPLMSGVGMVVMLILLGGFGVWAIRRFPPPRPTLNSER